MYSSRTLKLKFIIAQNWISVDSVVRRRANIMRESAQRQLRGLDSAPRSAALKHQAAIARFRQIRSRNQLLCPRQPLRHRIAQHYNHVSHVNCFAASPINFLFPAALPAWRHISTMFTTAGTCSGSDHSKNDAIPATESWDHHQRRHQRDERCPARRSRLLRSTPPHQNCQLLRQRQVRIRRLRHEQRASVMYMLVPSY